MNSQVTENQIIQVLGLEFIPLFSPEQIDREVQRLGAEISRDYAGKDPLCIAILNGAFMFTADLVRAMRFDPEIAFVRVASYKNTTSTGNIDNILGLSAEVRGREIIIIEDIVDTGHTIAHLKKWFTDHGAKRVVFTALLFKTDAYMYDIPIDYTGFAIPNRFVVGYGLDYNGYGRSLPGVYILKEETD